MIALTICQQRRQVSVDKPCFRGMTIEKIKEKWEKRVERIYGFQCVQIYSFACLVNHFLSKTMWHRAVVFICDVIPEGA